MAPSTLFYCLRLLPHCSKFGSDLVLLSVWIFSACSLSCTCGFPPGPLVSLDFPKNMPVSELNICKHGALQQTSVPSTIQHSWVGPGIYFDSTQDKAVIVDE